MRIVRGQLNIDAPVRLITVIALLCINAVCHAELPKHEVLNYKVQFKWGLIQKQAGRATLTLNTSGDKSTAVLVARSEPWADGFYQLRDTLSSTFISSDHTPVRYERIAHEDKKYARDVVEMTRKGNSVHASILRERKGTGVRDTLRVEHRSLTSPLPAVDLISVFYYLRKMDFQSISPGKVIKLNIISAKEVETLTITYMGVDALKADGIKQDAYHVRFTFSTKGKKESSKPIDTWISTDNSRIPLKLEGQLKIGKIRILYVGNKK